MTRLFVALLAVVPAGCGEAVFQCSNSGDCTGGFCEPDGYCSFEDPECPSGRRYGEFAGGGLAGTCTPAGDDGTGGTTQGPTDPSTSTSTSTTTSAGASMSSSGPEPETTTSTASETSPSSTSPTDTTMSIDDSGSDTTGEPPSSSSTGLAGPFTMSFGERDDADVQGVTTDSLIASWDVTYNGGAHADVHISSSEVGLLRFDVSELPAAAQVTDVALHIRNLDAIADGEVEMYRVTEAWAEGTADLAAGVCNWNDREEGVPWTSPGVGDGSHDGELLDSFAPDTLQEDYVLSIPGGIVEQWRDAPGDNQGLVFRSSNLTELVWFAAHEWADASVRPLLVVTYYE